MVCFTDFCVGFVLNYLVPLHISFKELDRLAEQQGEESMMAQSQSAIKSLHRIIAEHKDVIKVVGQLNTVLNSFKEAAQSVIQEHSVYADLWTEVRRR